MNLCLDGRQALVCGASRVTGAAAAIAFLAPPAAVYINGINLPVDGYYIQSL